MPTTTLQRFPCGEFLPGQEPRPNSTADTSVPPVFIPDPVIITPPFTPLKDLPRPGGGPGPTTPGGPRPGSPGIPGDIFTPDGPNTPGGGANPGGPRGPGGGNGGPITPGSTGPDDTGPVRVFAKCRVDIIRCTEPNRTYSSDEIDRLPIRRIVRTRVPCTFLEASEDVSGGYPFDPGGSYPGDSLGADFCLPIDIISDSFWEGCVNTEISDCITEPTNNSSQVITLPRGAVSVTQQQSITVGTNITNSNQVSQEVLASIPKKTATALLLDDPNIRRQASTSSSYGETFGLFDTTYNFFKDRSSSATVLVANSLYLNIFKDVVAEEVGYFIYRAGSRRPWSEEYLNSLSQDKIILSLREDLLTIFSNIHTIGGTRVSLSDFIEVIRRHLVTGTLDEFDPNYFAFIYNSQINDPIVSPTVEGETYFALQVALGLFELSATNPNYRVENNPSTKTDLKRMRFLLEDLETSIPSTMIDGTSGSLMLTNAGIPASTIESSSYLNIGDGAGYYVSSNFLESSGLALQTSNELSASRYIAPNLRATVLNLLGSNIGVTINSTAPSGLDEFSVGYSASSEVYPMYFKLDFDSIADIDNPNSVINQLSASYTRISDEEAINHSRNYSLNIVKVNLDYRDPLVHYARDSSSISLRQNEFNLREFDENRSIVGDKIILRNIPAAIIVTPGMGSAHNPFGGRSKVNQYGDTITRSIRLSPSFDVNNRQILNPPLQVSNIFDSLGTPYFGSYEQLFDQDLHGKLYTYDPSSPIFGRSYFYQGNYSSDSPGVYASSIESRLVSLVDKLSSLSGVESLTWWDVFRRVRLNDIGELAYSNPDILTSRLAAGWINNIRIYNVLTRLPLVTTGIPEDATVPNDEIVINYWDR